MVEKWITINLYIYIYITNKIIASTYGIVSGPYNITLNNYVIIDFTSADGWWLSYPFSKIEAKKIGIELDNFDEYQYRNIDDSIKTDFFIKHAKNKGFDSVVFKNIMDSGSIPIKGDKWIRYDNIVALYPKISVSVNQQL